MDNDSYFVFDNKSLTSNSYGYSALFGNLNDRKLNLDKYYSIEGANIIIPKDNYKKIFTYKNSNINISIKDSIITSNKDLKKNKNIIPYDEESELWTRNYFIKKSTSIFDLHELDDYVDDIGLILEVDISNQIYLDRDIEYYFYTLMNKHFKNKNTYLLPYND